MKKNQNLAMIGLVFYLAIAGVVIYSTQAQKPVENTIKGVQTQSEPLNSDKIFELVNAERAKVGVAPLVSDQRLVASAQTKADDMATNNYFGHINPTTGVNGYTLIPNGICVYKSENLGITKGYQDNNAQQIKWWLNSKPHHDAMLDAKYSLTGVAVNGDKVVQHFCQVK